MGGDPQQEGLDIAQSYVDAFKNSPVLKLLADLENMLGALGSAGSGAQGELDAAKQKIADILGKL